jgi:glycosyltransferase involved in cell wall biosynthesis
VTLIDDCSTDGSLAVMEELQRAHPSRRVEILRNEVNLNQAGSLNRAVERSRSRLFVVLNADDILTPDCLELIVGTYRAHPQLMLAGGLSYPFRDGAPLPAHRRRAREDLTLRVYGPADAVKFAGPNDLNISQSSSSFFRVAWEAVGGYWPAERRVCEFDDRDFQMRVCALFPVGVYEDYAMEFWRWGSSQGRTTI